ncbi:hypothetical protein AB0G02_05470 [Actinosynnema sp. NPDC023658]|uniref:hypothetical protein n=1 Tax=Actinosynnema sp. NPDC023658 TaxID=3155465 RepID=UPI0033C397B8
MTRFALFAAALTAAAVPLLAPVPEAQAAPTVPVIFVHGQEGSAQQFQSNAQRFSSNGYPDRLLFAYEYDTGTLFNERAVLGLAAFVDRVRAATSSPTVDLIAHSRGTIVVHSYLATPSRAAEVRRYVNVDGRSSLYPPGGVPTLALWSGLQPDGSIGGATNVHLPDVGHTETTTSAEGFAHIYRFLTGTAPQTTQVVPQSSGVTISGRATYFGANTGVPGRLAVWEVAESSGARVGSAPVHSATTYDGAFGPLAVDPRKRYELEYRRTGELTSHFYFESFERTNQFVRLQISAPGGPGDDVDRCSTHTAITTVRNREWWSDQGAGSDSLAVNGVEVLTANVAPRSRQVLAAFLFDDGCDRRSTLGAPAADFASLPFLTGVDVYLPPTGSIAVREGIRGTSESRTITVPAWRSDQDAVTVEFKDYADTR